MSNVKPILVSAGILVSGDRVLICQRRHDDSYGLQWEFPGGKVEEGETLATSLVRELREELAIRAEIGERVFRLRHRYPDRYVEVAFFLVRSFSGVVENRVFEKIEWARRGSLAEYRFLEADRVLVQKIASGGIF